MKSVLQNLVVFAFLSGLLLCGILGTSASMTFIWPGYFLLGFAGIVSISALFQGVSFSLPRWTTISVFLLVFYLLARAADSPVTYFAREDSMMILACVIAYAGFLSLCPSVTWRKGVALLFAGLVLLNLFFAALQVTFNPSIWLIPGYGRTMTEGMGGLFNQPDHFAIFLATLVPLWLAMGFQGREERAFRLFWKSLAAISVLFLLITGSVAGWIALLAGVACYGGITAFLAWERLGVLFQRSLIWVASLCVIGLGLFVSLKGDLVIRNLGHGLFAEGNESGVTVLWRTGVQQMSESPWIGTGSRSSQIYGRLFRSEELGPGEKEPDFVHNEFFQMAGDYGLIGLALVLLLLGAHLFRGLQFLRLFLRVRPALGQCIARSNHLAITIGALSGTVAIGSAACFDFVFHLPVIALMASVFLAVLAVPDPMSQVTREENPEPLIPGGTLLFGVRAVGFSGGIVLAALGMVFMPSEYHFEMARKELESGGRVFQQYRHLSKARELDPTNPFILALSAHAQVNSIESEMPIAERRQILEKADLYFSQAEQLYPQDIFAAIGHVAVLDELGKQQRARERLREARQWAPLYGNLMLAEAEHYLRNGQIGLAEEAYTDSLSAAAFRNEAASREGLRTISEWKLIAQQNGIPLEALDSNLPDEGMQRVLPKARVDERAVAGQVEAPRLELLPPF